TLSAPLSFGKTIVGLALAMKFFRTAIIVPGALTEQWIMEAKAIYGSHIFDPKSKDSPIFMCVKGKCLLHYESLKECNPRIVFLNPRTLTWSTLLRTYNPELVILDECQKGSAY